MEENKNYIEENKKLNKQIEELEYIYNFCYNKLTKQKDKLMFMLNKKPSELILIINNLDETLYDIRYEITDEIRKRENLIE